jgi:hypothetical protein
MTLTIEQYHAVLDAITVATTPAALADLHAVLRRELGDAAHAGFLELLIDLRRAKLTQPTPPDRAPVA